MTTRSGNMATETSDESGKRIKWQCGCRQHGGVMVQQWKPGDPDIDELIAAAKEMVAVPGRLPNQYAAFERLRKVLDESR